MLKSINLILEIKRISVKDEEYKESLWKVGIILFGGNLFKFVT